MEHEKSREKDTNKSVNIIIETRNWKKKPCYNNNENWQNLKKKFSCTPDHRDKIIEEQENCTDKEKQIRKSIQTKWNFSVRLRKGREKGLRKKLHMFATKRESVKLSLGMNWLPKIKILNTRQKNWTIGKKWKSPNLKHFKISKYTEH